MLPFSRLKSSTVASSCKGQRRIRLYYSLDELRRGVDLSQPCLQRARGQMQPVRHILGALLFEQGHIEEAEEVYRA